MAGEPILIADDSAEIRSILLRFLSNNGYRVTAVDDGQKAVAALRQQPFALVITDLNMPHVDGLGVLGAAKGCDPDCQVIILTGEANLDSAVTALNQGANSYLLKPVPSFEELSHLVQSALNQRALVIENRRLMHELRQLNAELEQRVAAQICELRAAYDELRKLDQMKADFVSMATGELRAPLRVLALVASVMREQLASRLPRDANLYLDEISSQIGRLEQRVDYLLDFTLLERGHLSLKRVSCQPAQLAREAVSMYLPRAHEKQIALELVVPAPVPPIVADGPRLLNALSRLLDNAVRYTEGPGRVVVSAFGPVRLPEAGPQVPPHVVLAVMDSGPGIEPNRLAAMRAALAGEGERGRRSSDGVGIGLTIATRILKMHGGAVTVRSTPGRGSTFALWIPTSTAPANPPK